MRKKLAMKICAIAMTAAMVASLAGCGNEDGNDSGASGNSGGDVSDSGNVSDGGNEDEGGSDEEEVTYDFGGATVRVNGNLWDNLKSVEDGNTQENYDKYRDLASQIEEKYNIKLEWVPLTGDDGYETNDAILATITNGECFADIFAISDDGTLSLREYLADITDDVNQLEVGSLWTEAATWNGRTYGLTFDDIGNTYILAYSREYLKNIGMDETPTDWFVQGKWSYADAIEYMTQLKAKLPTDTYPLSIHYFHWASMVPAANGIVTVDSDANLGITDEAYLEAMEFYVTLQQQGLAQMMVPTYDEETGITTSSSFVYGIDNMCTSTEARTCVMTMVEAWQFTSLLSDLSGEWGIVPWPWGSQVTCTGDYTTLSDNYIVPQSIWTNTVVPKTEYRASAAQAIPDIVLFLIARDFYDANSASGARVRHEAWETEQAGGIADTKGYNEGQERSFCTEQDIEVYDWIHTHAGYDWGHAVYYATDGELDIWNLGKRIIAGKEDARTVAESVAQAGEASMADRNLK